MLSLLRLATFLLFVLLLIAKFLSNRNSRPRSCNHVLPVLELKTVGHFQKTHSYFVQFFRLLVLQVLPLFPVPINYLEAVLHLLAPLERAQVLLNQHPVGVAVLVSRAFQSVLDDAQREVEPHRVLPDLAGLLGESGEAQQERVLIERAECLVAAENAVRDVDFLLALLVLVELLDVGEEEQAEHVVLVSLVQRAHALDQAAEPVEDAELVVGVAGHHDAPLHHDQLLVVCDALVLKHTAQLAQHRLRDKVRVAVEVQRPASPREDAVDSVLLLGELVQLLDL